MIRRTCTGCGGSGRVTTFFDTLFDPSKWFRMTPVTKRCPYCNGKGYVWQSWQDRPPRRR
jgi:DnaJ-class molecular chaperone